MPATKPPATPGPIRIEPVSTATLDVCVLGTMPLFQNRMSEKGARSILAPEPPKTRADKAATQKHDPRAEFRAAAQVLPDGPTYLGIPSTAFKGAMMTAALDTQGGIQKTTVGRLCYVEGEYVPVYGIPTLSLAMVRMADIKHTPDMRSRPVLARWAASLRVTYVVPNLDAKAILNLLHRAGTTCGVGDWRQEKGKGSFGRFTVVNNDDPEWLDVVATGGRAAQMAAMAEPGYYDTTTEELMEWFDAEMLRRGKKAAA